MQNPLRRIAVLFFVAAFAAAAYADLKITTRNTTMGHTSEGTTYIKGQRQRHEMQMGPIHQVVITQCDRRQRITVSDACQAYMVAPMDADEITTSAPPPSKPAETAPTRKGGTLTINTNTTNTGETQQMFGYTARHIKSAMTMTSSPDACNPSNMKIETDGWYADFTATGMSCTMAPRPGGGGSMGRIKPDCQDRIVRTGTGGHPRGYPMKVTHTTTDAQGRTYTMTQETTELSKATLDPALFEIPDGYRQVDDYQGLMCQAAYSGAGAPPRDTSGPRLSQRGSGRGALCVAPIQNRTATAVDNEAWRDTLITELQNVGVESVKLESLNQFDLEDEAVEKGCHVVLYSDLTDLKAPSGARRLGRAVGAGNAANYQSGIHVELMPLDEFAPWLDKNVTGTGSSTDASGEGALRVEAQEAATELSKPH